MSESKVKVNEVASSYDIAVYHLADFIEDEMYASSGDLINTQKLVRQILHDAWDLADSRPEED